MLLFLFSFHSIFTNDCSVCILQHENDILSLPSFPSHSHSHCRSPVSLLSHLHTHNYAQTFSNALKHAFLVPPRREKKKNKPTIIRIAALSPNFFFLHFISVPKHLINSRVSQFNDLRLSNKVPLHVEKRL